MSHPPLIMDPPGNADACVIWLHGLGADRFDFVPVVKALSLPAEHGVRFIFPQAPTRPVTINNGLPMPCWYDILGMSPARLIDEDQMNESAAMVRQLIDEQLNQGLSANRIVLAGFSQGGAVVLHAALESQLPLAGVMALSTYGPTLESLFQQYAEGPRLDLLFAHGQLDSMLPMHMGREAHDYFHQAGHDTHWHEYRMAHEVCPEEITQIRTWLMERLGL
ncbi:MAG TPA: alpha/beta hydrolase [Pseudomonas xinjiangensis]|uniref:Alpha/beta hydrolase n=2 Tax=root TaxID=1 RepID=A0A7V1BMJ6_9GAMM|nr:alpha/beta hydrolase [Halopseudomonas xinjiangensis]HEC49175.1 alpha/beta hydrolase [Halopseudomonas xinjiangensis]